MKVSLICTTYNCKENLSTTLSNIEIQDYEDIEVVIKDGASTDGTLDVIKEYAEKHDNVIWKSEPDMGIYDALNQGIELSSGDIIAICNDKLTCKDAVSKYVDAIKAEGEECVGVHSDLVYAEGDKIIRYWKMGQGTIKEGWMPGHPTLYLKREVYDNYGLYDTSLRCSADFEFMIRFLKDGENKLAYIPEVLVSMYYGGTSNQGIKGYYLSIKEAYMALRRNHVRFPIVLIMKRIIKTIKQFSEAKKEN